VVYRKAGSLLALERSVLEVAARRGAEGVYGFLLARELAESGGSDRLVAHGTLYKALDRMRRAGLLTAAWEDPDAAAAAGRPRRRVYAITAKGVQALDPAATRPEPSPRWGQAPA